MVTTHMNEVELKNLVGFSDLAEEPLVSFSPIHTYEQMPLVALDEAIEPLLANVPDVIHMLCFVKENCQVLKDGLTLNESASIMLYSIDWKPQENSFHVILNRTLRDENRERLKPWYLYLKLFMKSLSKLPSIHCYVYRGVQIDFSNEYPQGKTFTWWGFSLCTRSIEKFENKQFIDEKSPRTRFKIECKSAKDIRNHSLYKTTDEILLLSAQRYKVISSLDSGSGLHAIQVKEIDPYSVSSSNNVDRTSSISLSFNQRKPSISILIREASFCSVVLKLTGSSSSSSSSTYHNSRLEDLLTLCKFNSCIDLSVRELIDPDMPIIVQRAIIDKKCKGLYLTGNKLSSQSISILCDGLYNNSTLVELDLSDNHISDSGIQILIDVLSTNKSILKKLHLGSNNISDQAIKYLSDMLKTNQSLTHLLLNRNNISNRGVHLLSNVLALHNHSLEVLSFSANSLITDVSVDSLIVMLEQNNTLKELDIKYCNMTVSNSQRLRKTANEKNGFKLYTNPIQSTCFVS
ncbi:unnamed protein product [Rotaria magnacalcarata]|uniref:NAD(P)(+)--arginine ADP-ribosyltransferase n=1 Tax=Rotaria magnacalcarata TaxID=392030 RepID=A0A818YA32_9BILA|nr:unnamed protein product [Rotaria magnacalcarata]CAF3748086.1 unnamed protein product [Rotaria magnacalcarata]